MLVEQCSREGNPNVARRWISEWQEGLQGYTRDNSHDEQDCSIPSHNNPPWHQHVCLALFQAYAIVRNTHFCLLDDSIPKATQGIELAILLQGLITITLDCVTVRREERGQYHLKRRFGDLATPCRSPYPSNSTLAVGRPRIALSTSTC